ncbi:carboxymuconolactone decarboxylase family protein [Aquicella lusitana]|uniref:Alkyl hydroperoxide reductase AhpD n=1 Tax=Aquicella lusitana TaxID=254246 RepID=A0A370GYU8_9COXI|nr:carboxymuconolactone decarboxylase family protein [Aquicella lusitana]RDI48679.1 alkyl hydroperoxide reductase subunit D [Aquicella lusitana]VVC73944.1 Alkyl hydroperoxide reductase AhpD [Aquicella lusitana]
MNIETLKSELPDYAKDIRLNLGSVLSEEGASDLNQKQILSIALASAYATRNRDVIDAVAHQANAELSHEEISSVKTAATLMAMNNIYYRFTHALEDQTYATMPAKLRMTMMANPGIDKIIFELSSLAVSAINGCGKCMNAHTQQIEKAGISKVAVQSAIRIASVINATALAREIAN